MIYIYKYKDFKQCHEIELLREKGGGGERGGGLAECDVGQISICYPDKEFLKIYIKRKF